MKFQHVATAALPLDRQLQWIWYSPATASFITGDERAAFAIPTSSPSGHSALTPARPFDANSAVHHPCNLPIPEDLYGEFASRPRHGFRFLPVSDYDHAKDKSGYPLGDLLRMLVFGPDYGHYVLHPATNSILSLRSASIELLSRTPDGFTAVEQTRTRGRAALAFAAHPSEGLIAYGDNGGTFTAHRYEPTGFGKASKIAAKERKASRIEFSGDGNTLMLGGMGYLATFAMEKGKFVPKHETSIAVRDFVWLEPLGLVIVNQGLHGVTAFEYSGTGFVKLAETKPPGGVSQMAVADDGKWMAVTAQESGGVTLYALT